MLHNSCREYIAALQCGGMTKVHGCVPVGNISLRNFTASKSGLSSASPGRPCSADGGVASCAVAALAMAAPPMCVPAGWLATSAMAKAAAGQQRLGGPGGDGYGVAVCDISALSAAALLDCRQCHQRITPAM